MSYSRFSNSRWYTYWDTKSGENKEDQVFTICGITSFTYKQLQCGMEACLQKVIAFEEAFDNLTITNHELNELKSYMIEFLSDMDERFEGDENEKSN